MALFYYNKEVCPVSQVNQDRKGRLRDLGQMASGLFPFELQISNPKTLSENTYE